MSTGATMSKPNKPPGGADIVYAPNSPLLVQANKPPLKLIKYQNYGLKRLKQNKEIRNTSK
jgi:hypothetical protein